MLLIVRNLTRPRLAGLAAWVAVLLTTCTCAPSPPEPDGGLDAGRGWLDSGGRDAARLDAPRDVGRDAPVDAPRDGGPNDPEWVMLEGQPEGVELFVARHPERVVSVTTEACGEGCLRARCSVQCAWLGGFVEGERRVGWVQMPVELQLAALVDVDTGRALAAWKLWDVEEPTGRLAAPAYGGGRAAISAKAYPTSGLGLVSTWAGPADGMHDHLRPGYQLEVNASLVTMNFVSATHQVWNLSPATTIFLQDSATGARASFPERGVSGSVAWPHLIGDRVFYELWADRVRVWTGTVEEPATVLIDATPGDVQYFRTDGRTLVWLQGYEYDESTRRYPRLELWTSPYATRPEDVIPTRVSEFPGLYGTVFGAHWLAAVYGDRVMAVWDTRDGSRREWDPPDDGNVADVPLYATENEILVRTTVGTFRIDPNTLPIVEP